MQSLYDFFYNVILGIPTHDEITYYSREKYALQENLVQQNTKLVLKQQQLSPPVSNKKTYNLRPRKAISYKL